jgi:Raf kinase inhibitor-like YbhB/YbcL family protein
MLKRFITALLFAPALAVANGFSLESQDVHANEPFANKFVLKGFGCEGDNISPELKWKNAPNGTKSFAVTAYDPDAPTGSGWWHWVVFDLPADTTSLPQGAGDPAAGKMPKGAVQGRTDFGTQGWGGPCPPKGDKPHRFIFTVFALKTDKLDLNENTPAAMVGYMLNVNALAKASFVAKSSRK